MATLAVSYNFCLASGVMKMFAPSTMSLLLGTLFSSRKSRQLSLLIVFGRPPAGMNTSDFTLQCIELRRVRPSSVLVSSDTPAKDSLEGSKEEMGKLCSTRRSNSSWSSPSGSSATP